MIRVYQDKTYNGEIDTSKSEIGRSIYTFIPPLEGSALHSAADSAHTDNIVLRGVEVCYQHLRVRFRYYDFPLLPTWKTEMKING